MSNVDLGIPGLIDYTEIGSGGFATVYAALEPEANRRVAVKVLAAMDEGGRRRFDRERRTMGQTSAHDNIVTMFRSGYTDPGQRPYLVMEHMPRGSLQDRLDAEGRIDVDEALAILLPVVDGLGFAHSTGIVHKDVKPANILISATGSPKLTDFGIASIRDTTGTGQMAFSLLYTPPETFDATTNPSGETTDPRDERSDLYSVAATLYTLITGSPLFWADSQAALMRQILTEPPPRTGDPTLDGFLATALAKDPSHRFHTADQLSAAFKTIRYQTGVGASSISPLTVTDAPGGLTPSQQHAQQPPAAFHQSGQDQQTELTGPSLAAFAPPIVSSQESMAPEQSPLASPSVEPDDGEWRQPNQSYQDQAKRRSAGPLIAAALAIVVPLLFLGGFLLLDRDDGTSTATAEDPTATAESSTTTEPETTTTPPTEPTTSLPEVAEPIVYTGHTDPVWTAAQLSDGRIASAGPGQSVQIWDIETPETIDASYDGHSDVVVTVLALSDGRVASAGWGSTVHLWDPADPEAPAALYTGHQRGVEDLIELSDGRVASAATDSTVQIWDPADPTTTDATYSGHTGPLRSVVELLDGRLASASDEGSVHIWDPANPGTTEATYAAHSRGVEALAVLSDGRVASASDDATVHIWDPDNPDVTLTIYTGHAERVMSVVALSDGQVASGSADTTVQVWDPDDDSVTFDTYSGHSAIVLSMTELTDRRIMSASDDATVQVWEPVGS